MNSLLRLLFGKGIKPITQDDVEAASPPDAAAAEEADRGSLMLLREVTMAGRSTAVIQRLAAEEVSKDFLGGH